MSGLSEELAAGSVFPCKLCAFLDAQPPATFNEWIDELKKPVTVIANVAVVRALKRRGVAITEASVRRHRANHA